MTSEDKVFWVAWLTVFVLWSSYVFGVLVFSPPSVYFGPFEITYSPGSWFPGRYLHG